MRWKHCSSNSSREGCLWLDNEGTEMTQHMQCKGEVKRCDGVGQSKEGHHIHDKDIIDCHEPIALILHIVCDGLFHGLMVDAVRMTLS